MLRAERREQRDGSGRSPSGHPIVGQALRLPSHSLLVAALVPTSARGTKSAVGDKFVKQWELVANKLGKQGWSWGYSRSVSGYRILFTVDARAPDGRRFIVRSDQLLVAFREIERSAKQAKPAKS